MKIYVVEDELFQLEDLLITISHLGHECVGHGDDPLDILEEIRNKEIDLVLMDIHLPGHKQGIKLARQVKSFYQIPIIFTSSDQSEEIIKEASDIEPEAFLVKPVNENDLRAALILLENKKTNFPDASTSSSFFVKKGNKLHKVKNEDILHAYSDTKNYTSFVEIDGTKHTIRNSITKFLSQLSPDTFLQVHKSHVVNLQHIDYFHESNQVLGMKNGSEIAVGRTYKKALLEKINIL